jgi:hypothetical protein
LALGEEFFCDLDILSICLGLYLFLQFFGEHFGSPSNNEYYAAERLGA